MARKSRTGDGDVTVKISTGKTPKPARDAREEKERQGLFDKIDELRAQGQASNSKYLVRLYRVNPLTKNDDYLDPIPVEECSIDYVKQRYGGGEYKGRFVDAKTQKYIEGGGIWSFSIAGAARADANGTNGGGLTQADVALAEMKGTLAAMKDRPATAGDPAAMAISIATAMATVMTTAMAAMGKMVSAQPAAPQGDLIGTIAGVLDLLDRRGGNGGGEGNDSGLGLKMVDAMITGFREISAAQRAGGAPARRVVGHIDERGATRTPPASPAATPPTEPAPATAPEATVKLQQPETGSVVDVTKLKPYITQLVDLAKKDRDPSLYAAVMLDGLDMKLPQVIAFLEEQRTPEDRQRLQVNLLGAFPETAPYAGWFDQFFTALWAELDDVDNNDNPSGAPPRTAAGDTGGHDDTTMH